MKSDEVEQFLKDDSSIPEFRNPAHRAALAKEVIGQAAAREPDAPSRVRRPIFIGAAAGIFLLLGFAAFTETGRNVVVDTFSAIFEAADDSGGSAEPGIGEEGEYEVFANATDPTEQGDSTSESAEPSSSTAPGESTPKKDEELTAIDLVDDVGKMVMRGETDAYNAVMDKAETVAFPTPETAQFEEVLGFSEDRSELYITVTRRDAENFAERGSSRSIWSIDLSSGKFTPLVEGKIGSLIPHHEPGKTPEYALYFRTPRQMRMKDGALDFEQANTQLWLWMPDREPIMIDDHVVGGYIVASPDRRRFFYHDMRKAGVYRLHVHDIEEGESESWEASAGEIAIGWGSDGESLITIIHKLGGGVVEIEEFRRVSLDGQRILERVEGIQGRGYLGPIFSKRGYFYVRTREHGRIRDETDDRIEVFAQNPLRQVLSEPALGMTWSPDGKLGFIRPHMSGGRYSTRVYNVLHTDNDEVTEFDLGKISPRFQSFGSAASFTTISNGDFDSQSKSLSPDSHYFVSHIRLSGVGFVEIIDLDSLNVVTAFEDFLNFVWIWSPDSRRIAAYLRNSQDERRISIFDIESGKMTDLAHTGDIRVFPMIWADSETAIWKVYEGDLEEGQAVRLYRTNAVTGEVKVLDVHR